MGLPGAFWVIFEPKIHMQFTVLEEFLDLKHFLLCTHSHTLYTACAIDFYIAGSTMCLSVARGCTYLVYALENVCDMWLAVVSHTLKPLQRLQ